MLFLFKIQVIKLFISNCFLNTCGWNEIFLSIFEIEYDQYFQFAFISLINVIQIGFWKMVDWIYQIFKLWKKKLFIFDLNVAFIIDYRKKNKRFLRKFEISINWPFSFKKMAILIKQILLIKPVKFTGFQWI